MHCRSLQFVCFVVFSLLTSMAQESKAPAVLQPGAEYSGMYNFLRDGEFVQVTVEALGPRSGAAAERVLPVPRGGSDHPHFSAGADGDRGSSPPGRPMPFIPRASPTPGRHSDPAIHPRP